MFLHYHIVYETSLYMISYMIFCFMISYTRSYITSYMTSYMNICFICMNSYMISYRLLPYYVWSLITSCFMIYSVWSFNIWYYILWYHTWYHCYDIISMISYMLLYMISLHIYRISYIMWCCSLAAADPGATASASTRLRPGWCDIGIYDQSDAEAERIRSDYLSESRVVLGRRSTPVKILFRPRLQKICPLRSPTTTCKGRVQGF